MKKQSTVVYMGFKQTEYTQCISDERIMERAERRERSYSSQLRNKFLPYEQVTSTIKTNVAVIQGNADVVYRRERTMVSTATMLQRNNIRPVDDGQCNCYNEGCQF